MLTDNPKFATCPSAIVVDLDGTLTPTDTLVESLLQLLRQSPLNLLRVVIWLFQGRSGFKQRVAARVRLAVERLPYRGALLDYLRGEKTRGRRLVLATAAHESIAQAVAAHLGCFDAVLATRSGDNLKGQAKLEAIVRSVGRDFVYAGDSSADLPIWRAASAAILVGVAPRIARAVGAATRVEREFVRDPVRATDWLRALRVHQWSKNLLLFVPMLTAFSFAGTHALAALGVAFAAFSLGASASYLLNDLADLDSDRAHPQKRERALACARIPIGHGLLAAALCLAVSLLLASTVSGSYALVLLVYLLLTWAYSWQLKSRVIIDVLVLALLYTLRIVGGAVAIGVATSPWLFAFSVFVFLGLALVKRCTELSVLAGSGGEALVGRDYRVADLVVLWPLGIGASLVAIVVFGLYINAAEVQQHYASPQLLWCVAFVLVYWMARLWVKTARGQMHYDPVVFAIRDAHSRLGVLAMLAFTLAAHFLKVSG